jgi:outer membrane protein assembly factor BamB
MKTPSFLIQAFCLFSCLPVIQAADWSTWRGPTRDGISAEKDWNIAAEPKVLWEAEVGLGFSSFVTAGDLVFTSGHADGKDSVFCLSAKTGKVIWTHAYPADLGDKYYEGGTSATPTLDEGKLYHLSRWGDLFCF